jgi:hypothetical protein
MITMIIFIIKLYKRLKWRRYQRPSKARSMVLFDECNRLTKPETAWLVYLILVYIFGLGYSFPALFPTLKCGDDRSRS